MSFSLKQAIFQPPSFEIKCQIDEKNTGVGIKIINNITASGAISASGAIFTSDLNVNYAALPTSDPSVKGQIYRNGSNQLFVSAG